jgi:hypothetical protein
MLGDNDLNAEAFNFVHQLETARLKIGGTNLARLEHEQRNAGARDPRGLLFSGHI